MNFIFAVILLFLGVSALSAGFKTSVAGLDKIGRIMSFMVGIFLVFFALSICYPSVN
jgi:hypothetical protein